MKIGTIDVQKDPVTGSVVIYPVVPGEYEVDVYFALQWYLDRIKVKHIVRIE